VSILKARKQLQESLYVHHQQSHERLQESQEKDKVNTMQILLKESQSRKEVTRVEMERLKITDSWKVMS